MSNSLTGSILNNLGLTGGGLAMNSLVPPPNTPQSGDKLFRDFLEAGQVSDPNIWAKYGTAMRRPITYDQMLQLWDEMSGWDLVAAALVEIVDEATQTDPLYENRTVWYECNDAEVEEQLNDMLVKVGAEDIIQSQVWHIAAFGNSFEKIEYAAREGVLGLGFVHPMDVRRFWLEKNRQCIGYRWMSHPANKEDVFVGPDGTIIPRVGLSSGASNIEDLWYPWDFLHFRRMFRLRFSEHGEALYDEAQNIYKQLRMAIDQMVVHRAQIQPDRYAVEVDTGEQAPAEQMRTLQRWKQSLRSKLSYGDGSAPAFAPKDFRSYYNAWALDTILWVARPKGFQHSITKLSGTTVIPDIYDVEMLTNLFFSIIGMPRSWIGGQAGGKEGAPVSGRALLAQDMRFLRKIKSIRRPLISGYTWLGYFHCMLLGKKLDDLEIQAKMSEIGSLEDQVRLESLKLQTDVLAGLAQVMEGFNLPREAWIDVIFKRFMKLPDEVVNVFVTALPDQAEEQRNESKSTSPVKALAMIQERLGTAEGREKIKLLREVVHEGKLPRVKPRRYKSVQDLLMAPRIKENDTIVASNTALDAQISQRIHESGNQRVTIMGATIKRTGERNESLARGTEGFDADLAASNTAPPPQEGGSYAPYRRYLGERM